MWNRSLTALSLLVATLVLPAPAQADKRVALVVGNSQYSNASELRNPVNDANDVAATLKNLGFDVVLATNLSQQQFGRTIEQFARKLDDADAAMFFYAGHGLQINEKNYLVSVDARLENEFLISSETVDLEAIVRLMESKVPVNLVFLDACRNNPLTDGLKKTLVATRRSANLGRGLARIEPTGRDTLIAYAAAPGQEAADGNGRNSPFTSALLKHMPKPDLEVSVMLKQVAADVRQQTGNEQRPQQLSDMTKTFYFAKAEPQVAAVAPAPLPAPVVTPPSLPTTVDQRAEQRQYEMAFWNSVQSSNDCEATRAYLQRFPDGAFAELARLAERRLCNAGRQVTIVDAGPTVPPIAPAPVAASIVAAPPPPPPAPPTIVAALPNPAAAAVSSADLVYHTQLELIRLGCSTAEADRKWGTGTRDAMTRFNKSAKLKLDVAAASDTTLAALREQKGRVCPLECERGYRAKGNSCVAVKSEPVRAARKAAPPAQERRVIVDRQPAQQQQAQPSAAPAIGALITGAGIGIAIGRGW